MQPTKVVSREESIAARIGEVSGRRSVGNSLDATIRTGWKRVFELIRKMLVLERRRRRRCDDLEQRTNTGSPIDVYSPIFRWLSGRD